MMSITHALFALALSVVLVLDIPLAIIGGIIPDIDYLVGMEHRAFLHSFLFIGLILAVFVGRSPKKTISFTIGYLTHLVLDVITPQGIMLLYPWQKFFTLNLVGSYDPTMNLFLLLLSLLVLWNRDEIREMLKKINPNNIRIGTFVLLLFPLLLSIPITLLSPYLCESTSIGVLLSLPDEYDEQCVNVRGSVCSSIREYTSNSGNDYQIFDLCDDNDQILVWKTKSLRPQNFVEGDCLVITGLFTNNYLNSSGYELYKIKNVEFC
jgi:membrane-bound metal-dependent hydrolase YbcI (DUF457 family)